MSEAFSGQIVGIDPSLSRTAVVNGGPGKHEGVKIFSSSAHGPDLASRMMRYDRMSNEIVGYLLGLNAQLGIRLVAIENYSMGSQHSAAMLCEFGGILRLKLCHRFRVIEPATTALKKFVTGSGNANKTVYTSALAMKYGLQFPGEDEYFAYGLWLLARSALIPEAGSKDQAKIAAACLNPVKKEKKKRKLPAAGNMPDMTNSNW